MKRKNKTVIAFGIAALAAALTACADAPHQHEFSGDWAYNAFSHWHPASCGHDAKTDKVDHVFIDVVTPPGETTAGYTTHICACGYAFTDSETRPEIKPATDGDWQFDDEKHWQAVLGNGQPVYEEHEFKNEVVAPTCSKGGYTAHTCDTCGYWYRDSLTEPTLSHTFDPNVWEHNEGYHWHTSTCCDVAVGEKIEHRFVGVTVEPTCDAEGYTEYTCEDCGYSYRGDSKPASHSYSEAWTSDDFRHWHAATCSHQDAEKRDEGAHILDSEGHCKVCGKTDITKKLETADDGSGGLKIVGLGTLDAGDITIPAQVDGKNVTSIASSAFEGTAITKLTIQASITEIPDRMCKGCLSLSSVSIPNTVTEIGYEAFAGSGLTGRIPLESTSDIKIGPSAFKNCVGITEVEISGSTDILASAFANCTQLKMVETSDGIKSIGDLAFNGCTALTSLYLDPTTLTYIGFSAFGGCVKYSPDLDSFDNNVTIGEYAFTGCGATTLTLSDKIVEMGAHAFASCASLGTVTVNGPIVSNGAFENCGVLTTVTITNAMEIGASAFKNCGALATVTFTSADNLTKVGEGAFEGTAAITTNADGIKYVGNIAVGYDSTLTGAATLKTDTVGIADGAFRNCDKLSSVNLQSVKFIGANAFRNCKNLRSVEFPATVTRIGANAFRESGLTSVSLPDTVQSVGDNAFFDCASLVSAEINAKHIGKFAFSYTGVNRTLGNTVKQRPDYAKLATVVLGNSVETIGSNAFQYCPIKNITLPANLKEIGAYAFAQTDITSVTVPASVNRIGDHAFYQSLITSATFEEKTGWSAGDTALNLADAAASATMLKETYRTFDWVRNTATA